MVVMVFSLEEVPESVRAGAIAVCGRMLEVTGLRLRPDMKKARRNRDGLVVLRRVSPTLVRAWLSLTSWYSFYPGKRWR